MEILPHQQRAINTAAKRKGFAYFLDMGTGKTATALFEAQQLYDDGLIDNIMVVGPKGFDDVWKKHAILILTNPEIMSTAHFQMVKKLIPSTIHAKTLFIIDESQFIKTPASEVSKALLKLSFKPTYKRILTGTPITNTPFDAYSQMLFIDNTIWMKIGIPNFTKFKEYFAEQDSFMAARLKAKNSMRGTPFIPKRDKDGNVIYKNMDVLKSIIDANSITITKAEAGLNLPEKNFIQHTYSLTEQQRSEYETLKQDMFLQLNTTDFIQADTKMVLALKLHQLICAHPQRAALALKIANKEPAIIYCRFLDEIDAISAIATESNISHAVYRGNVATIDRARIVAKFQKGELNLIIANAHTAGRAITLTRAKRIIYSSKSYNWEHFKQSQDRAHRIGLEHELEIHSIEAEDTIDQLITENLTNKTSIVKGIINHVKSIHHPDANSVPSFVTNAHS